MFIDTPKLKIVILIEDYCSNLSRPLILRWTIFLTASFENHKIKLLKSCIWMFAYPYISFETILATKKFNEKVIILLKICTIMRKPAFFIDFWIMSCFEVSGWLQDGPCM